MKTAGDAASGTLDILAEAGGQLLGLHRRGSELPDNDRARVIGDIGGFDRRSAAAERQGEQSDRRIPSAGDIEDLARACVNMMRRAIILEKHHSFLTKRDEDQLRFPLL